MTTAAILAVQTLLYQIGRVIVLDFSYILMIYLTFSVMVENRQKPAMTLIRRGRSTMKIEDGANSLSQMTNPFWVILARVTLGQIAPFGLA
jgi:uncharacterized membrane protein